MPPDAFIQHPVPSRSILGVYPRSPKRTGCSALQDAIATCDKIRNTESVVPPAPGQRVIRVDVPEPGIRAITQITEPQPGGGRKPPQCTLQPFYLLYFIFCFTKGEPFFASLCSANSTPFGYAATEGGKAESEDPPAPGQRVIRADAPEPGTRATTQITEPQPFSQRCTSGTCV